jgi:putative ABC transport system substrate-binding protein
MRRREFIGLLCGVTVAWPIAARAQQPSIPVIGFLRSTAGVGSEHLVKAFRQGLGEAGFVEGQNIAIEYRWADDQFDRVPGLAADLVHRKVAAIVGNAAVAQVAKAATTAIPIVFWLASIRLKQDWFQVSIGPAATLQGWSSTQSN